MDIQNTIMEIGISIMNMLISIMNSYTQVKNIYILVLPIDIENPYRLSNCLYRYISIYIGFLATNF